MSGKTVLLVLKLILAVIALYLGISRGKKDKEILVYWLIVATYWIINALT